MPFVGKHAGLYAFVCLLLMSPNLVRGQEGSSRHIEGLREHRPLMHALIGGDVVVAPGRVLEGATVLVDEGQIVAVGIDVTLPPQAIKHDCTGLMVYPAWIDASTSVDLDVSEDRESAYWNSNITPESNVAKDWHLRSESAVESGDESWRDAGFGARLVAPSSGILKGQSSLLLTSDAKLADRVLASDVAQHARLTVDRGQGERDSYPNSPMGAVALARQALYDAQWYLAARQAVSADASIPLPEFNESLAALEPVLNQTQPLVIDTSNELMALRADRFAREFGASLIINGSGNEYRRLDDIVGTGRTVLVPVDFPKPPNVATVESSSRVTLEELMHWDLAPENPARLQAAGVKIALTTRYLEDPSEFWPQVRRAVQRGLNEDAALAAVTQRAAEILGVDDRLGTIEPGKVANLVVMTASPFVDEEASVVETWVAGQVFEVEGREPRHWQGAWRIQPEQRAGFTLDLQGSDASIDGSIMVGKSDEGVELQQVAVDGHRLSALIPGETIRGEGPVRLTLVLDALHPESATGVMEMIDGSRVGLSARLRVSSLGKAEAEATSEGTHEEGTNDNQEDDQSASDHSVSVNFPLGAYGRETPEVLHQTVVFRGVTVWTCGPAGIIENGQVLIRDGKIVAVGKDIEVPGDVVSVDASGMHLTPGIIDCHSHMATDGGVNESGQAITAEVRIGDFVDCDDINIYRQLAGGVTVANILHGSANPIGGQNQVIKLRWGHNDEAMKFLSAPQGIKFALGENVKQANWGDDYTTRYPQTRMGVEQIMRDEFHAARDYRARWDAWQKRRAGLPPRKDLELEAIAEIVEGSRWIHCHSYRQDEILALIRTLDDFGIQIGSFQHILEGYKVADAMAKHGATASAFADWWAYKFEVVDAIPYAGALMHEAGVIVSFNSDDRELARHLNHEAAKAVKYGGVAPEEALKFVTLNPAIQLRIDDHVGSIEVGKDADLALWNGPPLSSLSRCEQTWVDGVKLFDRDQDKELRSRDQQMRMALIRKVLESGEEMAEPGENRMDPASLWPRSDLFCHGHDHEHGGH